MEEPGGDTPRTDAAHKCAEENSADSQDAYVKILLHAEILERELASANKRADEARAVAIEDVCKLADNPVWANFDDLFSKIRALAKMPPGHVVVPIKLIEWISKQESMPDHACAECVPSSPMLVAGFQCAVHYAKSKLAERPK